MQLDENSKVWSWDKRNLTCRIRVESGNPARDELKIAGDELRANFAKLAGIDIKDLLADMKSNKKHKDRQKMTLIDENDKIFKDVLSRSHVFGAAEQTLQKMEKHQQTQKTTIANKNKFKQFTIAPKSPPRRVLLEIQRVRAAPDPQLPDPDDDNDSGSLTINTSKKSSKKKAAGTSTTYKNPTEDDKSSKFSVDSPSKSLMATVLQEYKGDMFGTGGDYLDSMIYLSRMADAETKTNRKRVSDGLDEDKGNYDSNLSSSQSNNRGNQGTTGNKDKNEANDNNNNGSNLSNNGTNLRNVMSSDTDMNPDVNTPNTNNLLVKLNCARSLCNWARDPANANRLASEGAVIAILQLFTESNKKILRFCAAAYRFMSEHLPLATVMIDENITNTIIADTILSQSDDFITYNLAIALVNLTRINGKEAQLVDAAAVLVLQNLILVQPDLSSTCARGLYNLTCVDSQYNYIERVIRALISLSSSLFANVKHICVAALCNLSDLRSVRPRLVEEGVISVIGQVSRGAETRTRRICAVILQNLSASKICRVDMTSKNSVSVAYSLSSDQDPIILRAIGLTLSKLATEPVNCNRIIHEAGITALCNIGTKYPHIPGIAQPIAIAFQLLASHSVSARTTIVREGNVTAISNLLRISNDLVTIQHALLALCHLLMDSESHLVIVQQGLVLSIMELIRNENDLIKDFCSLAFFNLSLFEDSKKHIVNSGAIVSITTLARHHTPITKRRCAATLCNVSTYEAGLNRMVSDGIIQCLVQLVLSSDVETIHSACVALCRLCITEENGKLIYESGAIPNLVKRALDGDVTTKQFCGAVLSSLSYYEICRLPLCEHGILKVLSMLAELKDTSGSSRAATSKSALRGATSGIGSGSNSPVSSASGGLRQAFTESRPTTDHSSSANLYEDKKRRQAELFTSKQSCLIAYANLSCERQVQIQMINEGVVSIIASLACGINSYQEMNYLCCAKAMCNLACNQDINIRLAHDGGIYALLMIALVSSVEVETKQLCLQSFLNLLNENTVQHMLQEDIISAIINLSKISDVKIVYYCALLVNQLTKFTQVIEKLIEKPSYLTSLFHIYHIVDNLIPPPTVVDDSLAHQESSHHRRISATHMHIGPVGRKLSQTPNIIKSSSEAVHGPNGKLSHEYERIQTLIAKSCCNLLMSDSSDQHLLIDKCIESGVLTVVLQQAILYDHLQETYSIPGSISGVNSYSFNLNTSYMCLHAIYSTSLIDSKYASIIATAQGHLKYSSPADAIISGSQSQSVASTSTVAVGGSNSSRVAGVVATNRDNNAQSEAAAGPGTAASASLVLGLTIATQQTSNSQYLILSLVKVAKILNSSYIESINYQVDTLTSMTGSADSSIFAPGGRLSEYDVKLTIEKLRMILQIFVRIGHDINARKHIQGADFTRQMIELILNTHGTSIKKKSFSDADNLNTYNAAEFNDNDMKESFHDVYDEIILLMVTVLRYIVMGHPDPKQLIYQDLLQAIYHIDDISQDMYTNYNNQVNQQSIDIDNNSVVEPLGSVADDSSMGQYLPMELSRSMSGGLNLVAVNNPGNTSQYVSKDRSNAANRSKDYSSPKRMTPSGGTRVSFFAPAVLIETKDKSVQAIQHIMEYLCEIIRLLVQNNQLSNLFTNVTSSLRQPGAKTSTLMLANSKNRSNQATIITNTSFKSDCIEYLASPTIIKILHRVSMILPNYSYMMYHIGVIVYLFSTLSSEHRQEISIPEIINIICYAGRLKQGYELISTSLNGFLFDTKCRYTFAVPEIASLLQKIITSEPEESVVSTCISSIYAMSKLPRCREFLTSPPISMDNYLMNFAQTLPAPESFSNAVASHNLSKLKYNVTRVLKNFTAVASTEAIEEGAVASLISLSLEGRPKSRIGNDAIIPDIIPFSTALLSVPACAGAENLQIASADVVWYEKYTPIGGGAAKKGITPPKPPDIRKGESIASLYPSMNDDIDSNEISGNSNENKTKMSFAKMQIPLELRGSFLLTDQDFHVKPKKASSNDDAESIASDDNEEDEGIDVGLSDDGEKLRVGGTLDNDNDFEEDKTAKSTSLNDKSQDESLHLDLIGSEDSPNSRNKEKSKNRIHQIKSLSHKSKNKKSKNETDEETKALNLSLPTANILVNSNSSSNSSSELPSRQVKTTENIKSHRKKVDKVVQSAGLYV